MKTLNFIQIYFKDEQKDRLYPFAAPYKNEGITDYFENKIIADLVPNLSADIIGVCSWRLAQKRGDTIVQLKGDVSLTEEKILNTDYDIAVLTPRSPRHQPLTMASMWHGQAWNDAFSVFKKFLKSDLGINVPDELKTAIYENHFIANKEIYQDYVRGYLLPSMAFMQGEEVFKANSGYISKKRNTQEVKDYQEKSGRKDWPISTFVLERLFSIYCEGKNFKIINL